MYKYATVLWIHYNSTSVVCIDRDIHPNFRNNLVIGQVLNILWGLGTCRKEYRAKILSLHSKFLLTVHMHMYFICNICTYKIGYAKYVYIYVYV
jgi:hypothetical protein